MLRDLQQSGLFRAVFSYHTPDEGRYVVQGGVEDFFLKMGKTGRTAVAALVITLEDTKQHAATRRILYQKKYRKRDFWGPRPRKATAGLRVSPWKPFPGG
ncbi:MAG: hypothetical protein M0P74_03415 [Syntrophales bacterium]|nr:hypothetical protein [Syntrophales bacterium]